MATRAIKLTEYVGNDIRKTLAREIMEGSNVEAVRLLRKYGFTNFMPGEEWVPLESVAVWYGVRWEYLRGVMDTHRIRARETPNDLLNIGRKKANAMFGFGTDYWNAYDGVSHTLYFGKVGSQMAKAVPTRFGADHRESCYFLLPRLVLALAALCVCGRTVPKDSNVLRVYKLLEETPYYLQASKLHEEAQKKFEEERGESAIEDSKELHPATIPITQNGEVTVSVDWLTAVIQTAVEKAMVGNMVG